MNKIFKYLLLVVLATVVLGCSDVTLKSDEPLGKNLRIGTMVDQPASFPAALRRIDQQAFEGTAFTSVHFNKNLSYIGDEAFSGAVYLRNVGLPESIELIGYDALPESAMLYVEKGSYAETWAKNSGRPFVVSGAFMDKDRTPEPATEVIILLICLIAFGDDRLVHIRRYIRENVLSMRPQDRPELYPIQYRFP